MPAEPAHFPLGFYGIALVLSFALTGLSTWYARRRGMFDLPGERHSHTQSTPRGGGAGLVLTLVLMPFLWPGATELWPFWFHCLLPGLVLLGLVGWWDDHTPLSVRWRFAVQVVVSIYLLWCFGNTGVALGWGPALVWAGCLLWMTNLYNFMDGSNGMAGTQGVYAGLLLAYLFHQAGDQGGAVFPALVAVACAGFLPWNLGRARVFMGDVASGTLGFTIAALLFYGVTHGVLSLAVAWMVMLVFVCDSTLTLLGRVMRGERWYNPHKQHLYQRLIEHGWSHGRVLSLYQLINLALVVPVIVVAVNYPALAEVLAGVLTTALAGGMLLVKKKLGVLA